MTLRRTARRCVVVGGTPSCERCEPDVRPTTTTPPRTTTARGCERKRRVDRGVAAVVPHPRRQRTTATDPAGRRPGRGEIWLLLLLLPGDRRRWRLIILVAVREYGVAARGAHPFPQLGDALAAHGVVAPQAAFGQGVYLVQTYRTLFDSVHIVKRFTYIGHI
jgi:hypothetical protein